MRRGIGSMLLQRRRRLGKRSKHEVQRSPSAEENGECKESDDEGEVVAVEEEEEEDDDDEEEEEEGEQEQEQEDDDDDDAADAMLPEKEEDGGDPEAVKYIRGFEVEVIEDLRTAIEECGGDGDGETTTTGKQQQQKAARRGDDRIPGAADRFVEWVLSPLSLERFHSEFWERKPFLIRRPHNRSFYDGWLGKADIEKLLETQSLRYGVNLDVTKYEDGARSTFSSDGDAKPSKVWKKFSKGWSVRILHPQRWSDPIFWMLSAFERYWRSVAGCNAYLTPPGSQGFSPHYDDIEAFVIQTEGKKHWKCYRPRSSSEVLPRFSSPNFEQLDLGKPILDVVLEAGDILYMPRGTIHQAKAASDMHSLHITVSVGQRNCWADFLELAVPRALELATEDHLLLRQNLPRGYSDYMGVAHSEREDDPERTLFIEQGMQCMNLVMESIPWDSAADQLAVKFLQSRLPLPSLATGNEENGLATRGRGNMPAANLTGKQLWKSKVRLVAPDVARLVVEEDSAVVYHMLSNRRVLHNEGDDESCMEPLSPNGQLVFSLDAAPALEELTMAFPEPVQVAELPMPRHEALTLVTQLCEIGLLIVVDG